MNKQLKATFACLTLGSLVATACHSLGTEVDQSEAGSLWSAMSGYNTWGSFEGHEGIEKSKSVHGSYVRTFVNSVGMEDTADPGFGTIIVKEGFKSNDASTIDAITVMQRKEGYDPDNNDWFWARYTPKGELTDSGKVAFCSDCHFDAGNDDFIFLND